ncbi:MAG: 16S rRNA (cytidine(1402)-2'-O)-methyltransferase [Clostridia bacterium]|nr:16S rRNA (cytidine(1402)-2'-O)-methyltransferase [Clostridia bacterium]
MPRTLYLVATPIGNLSDMSERALKVLSEVDFVAAEDTRNTQRLLTYFGISGKPLVSYHEHNKAERGEKIVERLAAGESCALVTDAGTPAISDPGADLVKLCAERGISVSSIPGACAAVVSLTLSALPTERFCFEGFLPTQNKERKKRLERLSGEDRTMVFHEAPHKLRTTLDDLAAAFGESRKISLCRELTKLNEDVMRTTLGEAVKIYREREPKGEYVLVVEGTQEVSALPETELTIQEQVAYYIEGGMSKMDAIKATAKSRGMTKNDVYKLFV